MVSLMGFEPISVSPNKQDPAWKYCQVFINNGEQNNGVKVELKKCIYCGKMFQGGGIHRLKEHLAGRKGNGPTCDQVPSDVRIEMQQSLNGGIVLSRRRKNRSIVNRCHSLSEIDNSLANQEEYKMIEVPISDVLVNGEDVGISSLSVERRMRGRVRNSFALASDAGVIDNCTDLSGDLAYVPVEVDYRVANSAQLRPIGVYNDFDLKPVLMLGDTVADSANNGTQSSDSPAPTHGEKDNSFFEHTPCRLIDVPNTNFLVNQEEEIGIDNTNASKRKRGMHENSSVSVDDGNVSRDSKRERATNQQIHMAIGRFLYEIGAPLDAVKDSVYFQPMIDAIASGGSGVLAPSYHDLRGWILKNAFKEVRNDIDRCTKNWAKSGCSILASQWNTGKDRTFLNFAVYCSEGTIFFKYVDASNILCSADALYELLKQVVEEVGVEHVLQVITTSEEKYTVAGKRLMDAFPTLYWSPCAAHCIELILVDFGKVEWINSIIEQAKSVTIYIYKHAAILNMMRRYTFGIDIVRPGVFVFATNFTTLKQMADLKLNLQSFVISQEWMGSQYSRTAEGLKLFDTLTNRSFWSSCLLITRLTTPILRVLRIACSQKTAAMGYVFAGIYRAKEIIKRELVKKEDYMIYWNIIDHRWKKFWHLPLHVAGFYLNPKFFYSIQGEVPNFIMSGMFDCIERLIPDIKVQDTIIKEMSLYKNAVGDLGRKLAIRARDTLLPGKLLFIRLFC